ncbi:MAG: hypothetical protein NVSMB21_15500 [Vulcanimicrobiaceae bacterium]
MDLHRTEAFRRSRAWAGSLIAVTLWLASSLPARAESTVPIVSLDSIDIAGAAFSGASGAIRVNQAAGVANAQSNAIVLHLAPLSDGRLDSVTALQTISSDTASGASTARGRIAVSADAFAGSRGVVQINQSAGNANVSANAFTLDVRR